MKFFGLSSVSLGTFVLTHNSITRWAPAAPHWSALVCGLGVVGLLVLTLWSEKYHYSEASDASSQLSSQEDLVPSAPHTPVG